MSGVGTGVVGKLGEVGVLRVYLSEGGDCLCFLLRCRCCSRLWDRVKNKALTSLVLLLLSVSPHHLFSLRSLTHSPFTVTHTIHLFELISLFSAVLSFTFQSSILIISRSFSLIYFYSLHQSFTVLYHSILSLLLSVFSFYRWNHFSNIQPTSSYREPPTVNSGTSKPLFQPLPFLCSAILLPLVYL